jgi:hypothetical protein
VTPRSQGKRADTKTGTADLIGMAGPRRGG